MALSFPGLKQGSQSGFSSANTSGYTENIGTSSKYYGSEVLKKMIDNQKSATSTYQSSNSGNYGLKDVKSSSMENGNPLYRSGVANLNGLSIPNAIAQSMQYENAVNQGRSGIPGVREGDNTVLQAILNKKSEQFNKDNSALTKYGDTEAEAATVNSELNSLLRPEIVKEELNAQGQNIGNESALTRQLRIKQLQIRLNSLSKTMASSKSAAGGSLNDSGGIRDLLNNYIPTTSNLPIKESVISI